MLWKEVVGLHAEHKTPVDDVLAKFRNFDDNVLNHEAFLSSQQAHFNYIEQNPAAVRRSAGRARGLSGGVCV